MNLSSFKRKAALVAAGSAVLGLSISTVAPAQAAPTVTITWLTPNSANYVVPTEAIAKAFMAKNKDIKVVVKQRLAGSDGDNIIKTKLATKTMENVFTYNAGSLFEALAPTKTLVDLSKEAFQKNVDAGFKNSIDSGSKVFGAPFGPAEAGGVYYNKDLFKAAGITSTPKTWAELIEAAKKLKASSPTASPICASFASNFTAQIYVLADYHNVNASVPKFETEYTANKRKFAFTPSALRGFEKLEEAAKLDLLNSDKNTATRANVSAMMSEGKCAMYPWLTTFNATLTAEARARTGFFAFPGDSAKTYGLTTWMPNAVYVPTTTTGTKLAAAKKLVAFIASKAGTDAYVKANGYLGPFFTKDQSAAPATVDPAVKDFAAMLKGKTYPALEFLSPAKGPNLAAIMVDLGNGRTTAKAAAALYDQDVYAAARQLGLKGW